MFEKILNTVSSISLWICANYKSVLSWILIKIVTPECFGRELPTRRYPAAVIELFYYNASLHNFSESELIFEMAGIFFMLRFL